MIESHVVLHAVSRGISDMKRSLVAAVGAALVAVLGANSAAHAAAINFMVTTIDGAPDYMGATLDQSTELNLDNAILLVSEVGPHDMSGLTPFKIPVTVNMFISIPQPAPPSIEYGSGKGIVDAPILNGPFVESWTGGNGDTFTETLTTVDSITRGTNQIIVQLQGTVSDTDDLFVDAQIFLVVNATQFGGPGTATGATLTSTSTIAVIPEASTWSMMGLGFAALGYAASRRRSAKAAILSA
jgi:hypothetical protein